MHLMEPMRHMSEIDSDIRKYGHDGDAYVVFYIAGYTCYGCGWSAPCGHGSTPDEARDDAFKVAERRYVGEPV